MLSGDPIPYGRQDINQEDIDAVIEALRSDFLTQGPRILEFENQVAKYCGAKFAVAVSNATGALHIACLAAGLKKGDSLWTSPNTFVASANCGLYCNASVDFVDIEPKPYNLCSSELEKKLSFAEKAGKLPKVVIPVDFAGQSGDLEKIYSLSRKYNFTIIQDASHAIGSSYKKSKTGSCKYSDMTVFSFHPVKIITTGEGGMILTNRKDLYDKLLLLRTHGITRSPHQMNNTTEGGWYYEQVDLGFNYRITDFQAALGLTQLKRIDHFIERRHQIATRYQTELKNLPLTLPYQSPDCHSSLHLYPVQVLGDRKTTYDRLIEAGIKVNVHYIPVHLQPYYAKMGFKKGDFPVAEKYYNRALSLPIFFNLTDEQQSRIITAIQKAVV